MGTYRCNSSLFRKFATLILFLVLHFPLTAISQNDYFSHQNFCSSEELAQLLKGKTLDMCWNFGRDSHFRFVSANDEVYFEIYLGVLPDCYNDFVAQVKDRFIEKELKKSNQLVFSYKIKSDGTEEVNIPQIYDEKECSDEYSYIVAKRRVVENANPQQISQEELEAIIKHSNILFYTGSGLSLASDVSTMNELLGLEKGDRFLYYLESTINNPKEFASKIIVFHKACLFSPPTKAHIALKEFASLKNIRIVTENLDCLHESSGIYPYRIDAVHLRDEIGSESLAQFKYIICIGLSYDDRGFLGWYKQHNPHGKIIAVDLHKPSYLGNEDFLVIGDLQEIIPSLKR